jgi:hypothetical protein
MAATRRQWGEKWEKGIRGEAAAKKIKMAAIFFFFPE